MPASTPGTPVGPDILPAGAGILLVVETLYKNRG